MIKLKQLIKEGTYQWSTSHLGKVPDEVIDAVHKIIAVVERDTKDEHPEYWASITNQPPFSTHLVKSQNDVWHIVTGKQIGRAHV